MPSPVRQKRHSEPHGYVIIWLGTYMVATPKLEIGDNATVRLDDDNDPQPDVLLRLPVELGGQSDIDKEDYIVGAPELIVEIAASSVSYDLYDKKDVYGQFGVQEYIVWRVVDQEIDWFRLQGQRYTPLAPKDGIFRSRVLPGLWLHARALIEGDMVCVARVAKKGLASAEHKAFVEQLREIANRGGKKRKR